MRKTASAGWLCRASRWFPAMASQCVGENGKPAYDHLMTFDTREIGEAFSRAVIAAVLERDPSVFNEDQRKPAVAERDALDDVIPF